MANCYEALVVESITSGNEIGMTSMCENKPKVKNNSQKENMMYILNRTVQPLMNHKKN
jgi:hypothetical protein